MTGRQSVKIKPKCFVCAKPGHKMSDCFYKPKSNKYKSHLQLSTQVTENQKKKGLVYESFCQDGNKHECESAFMTFVSKDISRKWFSDSCASHHLTNQKNMIFHYRELNVKEFFGSAAESTATKVIGVDAFRVRQTIDTVEISIFSKMLDMLRSAEQIYLHCAKHSVSSKKNQLK